jgi:hypothetical protein
MHPSKIATLFGIFLTVSCFAQKGSTITPDLIDLIKGGKIRVFNRSLSVLLDPQNKNAIHLDEKAGDGVAWWNDIRFSNGTIEFDVKGRNVMQQSFVGLAFHGLNDSTMDVVYFRPFNFQTQDTERRTHSVQYVSLPAYDWQRLRTEFPNKYEHSLNQSPQPEDWFHVRLVIESPKVSVYVNNNSKPDLVVEQLSIRKEGMIGFWVGNNSNGNFANPKITME